MITYLVVANGESSKSYKCNTTHTSVPYIRVNEKNYLDLTTETTTGLQLKYKQKTGSSYSTYNTTFEDGYEITDTMTSYYAIGTVSSYRTISFNKTMEAHATSAESTYTTSDIETKYTTHTRSNSLTNYDTRDNKSYTYSNYFSYTENISAWTSSTRVAPHWVSSSCLTTTQSKVTFKNRIYIPVQSQSTTVSTTKESLYTETTGYSGRSTYNTTTYTTTGYTGASWWSENHVSTTGYSAYSTSVKTTGSGHRSTTTTSRYSTTDYSQWYTDFTVGSTGIEYSTYYTGYTSSKYVKSLRWNETGFFSWMCPEGYYYGTDTWRRTDTEYRYSTTANSGTGAYGFLGTYSISYSSSQYSALVSNKTSVWTQSPHTWSNTNTGNGSAGGITSVSYTITEVGTQWNTSYYYTSITQSQRSATRTTGTGYRSRTTTSRYATTDYKDWYPDFTASVTGTSRVYNYWTSSNYPSGANNVTALTNGYTTRKSSLASSTAAGALSSTTALTSSGTRTSSSLKQSSKPGALISITELTITSTRTSLTNRTSSTDL